MMHMIVQIPKRNVFVEYTHTIMHIFNIYLRKNIVVEITKAKQKQWAFQPKPNIYNPHGARKANRDAAHGPTFFFLFLFT